MARTASGPWLRIGRGWYCTAGGRQHRIAKPTDSREIAMTAWHAFMAEFRPGPAGFTSPTPSDEITAVEVADRFLVWMKRNRDEKTYDVAERYLKPWIESLPKDAAAESLRPYDASEWIDLRHPKPGAKRMTYRVVKQAWKWAHDSGLIERNPLRAIKTPAGGRRETTLTPQQVRLVKGAASLQLRILIDVARLTGMRAQELRRIEARHMDRKSKCIEFPRDESKGKKRPRVVFVVDEAWKLLLAAAKKHKSGPVLRNEDGAAWTKDSIVCAFKRVRDRLRKRQPPVEMPGLCLTVFRHTYATDAVERSVDVLTLAELMGHKDATMISKVYAKVGQRSKHMRKAAKKAVGG